MNAPDDVLNQVAGLAGFRVAQCIVDDALSLAFLRDQQHALLRIEGPFRLRLDEEWELGPSSERLAFCPTLDLFGRTLELARLAPTGELELVLSRNASVLVYQGREHEAWTLSLPDNTLIVSGVDGEVSVFSHGQP